MSALHAVAAPSWPTSLLALASLLPRPSQLVILVGALLAALFLVLLQLPVPGSAVLMPALAMFWGAGLPLALGAAALSELPPLPEAAERLLPDSERELDDERFDAVRCGVDGLRDGERVGGSRGRMAQGGHRHRSPSPARSLPDSPTRLLPPGPLPWRRSAVLAVYAAEALLLAFSLKLRVSAALAGHRGPRAAAPAAAAALGLDDGSFHRAASFLGQCMPQYVTQPGAGRPTLKVRCWGKHGALGAWRGPCGGAALVQQAWHGPRAASCSPGPSPLGQLGCAATCRRCPPTPPLSRRRLRRAWAARRCSGCRPRAWAGCPRCATWSPASASASASG